MNYLKYSLAGLLSYSHRTYSHTNLMDIKKLAYNNAGRKPACLIPASQSYERSIAFSFILKTLHVPILKYTFHAHESPV